LRYAASLARRQGVFADEALLAEGLVPQDTFYRALAAHLNVDFVDADVDVAPSGPAAARTEHGYARLIGDPRGLLWLFAPNGPGVARLIGAARAARSRPLFAVTPRARFLDALRRSSSRDLARMAAFSAERADGELCARSALRRRVLAAAIGANATLLACLFGPFEPLAHGTAIFLALMFLASVFLRLFACAASYEKRERALWLDDARLPIYTIVIALYREAAVARQLALAIDRLDYPRAKLDVKFIVECDDLDTAEALRAHAPRAPHEIIVAPPGAPRTKPRALNIAMPFARGSLIAVFDAEDLPEPRQLRRAAAQFARAPRELACLQASLAIDNGSQNWMTGLYAIDYAALFDVYNKGLAALGLPLFLGGTSNHFRHEALRKIGFWDAYNVTEDADLGLRLSRAGYAIDTFASKTCEEAPAVFAALLKQRTRWLKGWMLTALVHCRRPRRLFAELGARRACCVLAMFTGGFAGPLLGPVLTAALVHQAAFGRLLTPLTPFEIARSTLWCFLALSGAAAIVWPLLLGMSRRRLTAYWPPLLLLPAWMLMLSLAAWRALFELWRRPFHWEKTEHGLTRRGLAPYEKPKSRPRWSCEPSGSHHHRSTIPREANAL
jgi:cellulose synthase/poly-beta-1,6-N-acetylglucosamine synthase-like glycosyltransferase